MIDSGTVEQIINAADIVDVVSDFVSLKKRGANWVGLCPFHNDRNPSFYVSRNKGICKCFSCGQGGSAVNFIMLHEQMSFVEALKYLAKKYHIEIKERELTDEERVIQTERESMLILNEWACQFFEKQLWETTDGKEIGLSYFRQRGFTDTTIRNFRLGYCPDNRDTLYKEAIKQGYNRELLFQLGLCKDDNHGGGYDFYRGRVMFPIFNVAGNVIAFGGRTLKKDDRAKYFNSPDSTIYNKSKSTMYGLYQAKKAISKSDKCFIVEGYADVISMHQAGFENVIASSGTALTDGHIHLLHRFTDNVTELFDGDDAGIKTALRGIDMLLKAGMNVKVLLLPNGEDPDSYAQTHSSSEVEQYVKENETDFISFKTGILLKDAANDPIKRSQAISDVVNSISVIPSAITRAVYAKECATMFEIPEEVLLREIQIRLRKIIEDDFNRKKRETNQNPEQYTPDNKDNETNLTNSNNQSSKQIVDDYPFKQEEEIIRYIIKYGMCHFNTNYDEQGNILPMTVVEFVNSEFTVDQIGFSVPIYKKIFETILGLLNKFYDEFNEIEKVVSSEAEQKLQESLQSLDPVGLSSDEIEKKEKDIRSTIDKEINEKLNEFREAYIERILCSHPDNEIRNTSYNLISERNQLSKIYTQYGPITKEHDRLLTLIPKAINNLKCALVEIQIRNLTKLLQDSPTEESMKELQHLYDLRKALSKIIGERVITP